jgi:ribosomal protein L29
MATKIKKTAEKLIKLTDLNAVELVVKIKEFRQQIQKKKLDMSVGRVKNMREVFHLRKSLARVKTVLNMKK